MPVQKESYKVGDVLHRTSTSISHYPSWKTLFGTIVSIKLKTVKDASLGEAEKLMYRSKYSHQEQYPLFEFLIKCEDGIYLSSQMHFTKVFS